MNDMTKQPKARKRKNKPTMPASLERWHGAAMGQANAENLVIEPATDFDPETGRATRNPNGVKRNRRKTMIEIYSDKLTVSQIMAASSLYRAYHGLPETDPLAAMFIDRLLGASDPLANKIDRRREFYLLWSKVPAISAPVMRRVVLEDLPIWGRSMDQRARHMERLCRGLDAISGATA